MLSQLIRDIGVLPLALLAIVTTAIVGLVVGRTRAFRVAGADLATLHSRPGYHGLFVFLVVILAGVGVFLIANIAMGRYVSGEMATAVARLAPDLGALKAAAAIEFAERLAAGQVRPDGSPIHAELAEIYSTLRSQRGWIVSATALTAALAGAVWSVRVLHRDFRARNRAERILRAMLFTASLVAIITTIGIFLSLIGETLSFLSGLRTPNASGIHLAAGASVDPGQLKCVQKAGTWWTAFDDGRLAVDRNGNNIACATWRVDKFLFGTTWSPLSGVHSGEISAERVGAIPLFLGTAMITVIAMLVAVPVGLFAAIYLSEYASQRTRGVVKPILEILAGIPTVVYGFFAVTTVAPFMTGIGASLGIGIQSESALVAGVVMGIMIIPFISSLSDDVINAVPQTLRDGSYGLGATQAETITRIVLPAALPGIVSATLLGISRAVGETMIVVMAVGQSANLTFDPLDKVTTVTVQITMLILGDTDAGTAAGPAYTLGFTLFIATLGLNVFALRMVRKYRQKYD